LFPSFLTSFFYSDFSSFFSSLISSFYSDFATFSFCNELISYESLLSLAIFGFSGSAVGPVDEFTSSGSD